MDVLKKNYHVVMVFLFLNYLDLKLINFIPIRLFALITL